MRTLLLALLLGACAGPPVASAPSASATSASAPAASATRPHLYYLGVALYGEAWSRNDVTEMADRLRQDADGFALVPTVLSGAHNSEAEIERAAERIGQETRPGDAVMIYVSTHGAPGVLARDLGDERYERVGVRDVRAWLAPLGARPTVLVLSACFSGSFIPALQAPNRIVLAAARADRSSFGCQPDATHSVFGEALLGAVRPHASLRSIVARTDQAVATRERAMGVGKPSEPQLFVGEQVRPFFDAEVF